MGERTDAKRSIESSTRRMTEIAEELSRRASPRYIGEQAREKALNKTQEWKNDLISSPTALGLVGGLLGAVVGRAIARNRRDARDWGADVRYRPQYGHRLDGNGDFAREQPLYEDLRYREPEPGVKEKIAGGAQELKDRASEVVSGVRERIPSAAEIGAKADENPMVVALGGLALGAIAAMLLPVTRKEREILEPVKQRAGEAIGTLGNRLGESAQQVQEKIAGGGAQEQGSHPATDSPPFEGSPLTH